MKYVSNTRFGFSGREEGYWPGLRGKQYRVTCRFIRNFRISRERSARNSGKFCYNDVHQEAAV